MRHLPIDQSLKVAVAHHQAGRFADAESIYRQVLAVQPNHPEALYLLGVLAGQGGRHADAIGLIQQAIDSNPSNPVYHRDLGVMLQSQGRLDETIACYQRAVNLKPDFAEAHYNFGIAWALKGQVEQAITSYLRATELKPGFAEAHYNLGLAWTLQNQPGKAIASFKRALDVNPDFAEAHNNLGTEWERAGNLDGALACYRRAVELKPDFVAAHDNLLCLLNFFPDVGPRQLYDEARRWNRQHAQPLARVVRPHCNHRNPERRLRIGYVSADFCGHASAHFLLPLFQNHDRTQVDLFCYAQVAHGDQFTGRFQDLIPQWRNTVGQTDVQIANMVREDQIDILVDLKLHIPDNRLLVLAQRPAPVQVTWLGYPGTTGMDTIDYRITDPYLDPPGCDESTYSEQSFRLPDTFWCYDPLDSEPHVDVMPCAVNGFITFGCLNYFCKVNNAVMDLWAKVLGAVAGSHLILLAPEGSWRQRVLDRLGRKSIASDRVEFVGKQSRVAYLRTYCRIDIALDTFPYNGHTTSLDSLWMGVPVVTLVGKTVVGRAGLSQLSNLGLTDLIAHTPEAYIRIATDLAADRPRLGELRATLRQRMERSPLMDAGRFARNIEAAYRTMWRTWCAT